MPAKSGPAFTVAVVQDASVFLDRDASVEKTIALAEEAAENGAKLVLFPEAFIPGYPRGLSFGAVVGSRSAAGRSLFRRYAENALSAFGPEFDLLGETAAELGIHLAVGVIERDEESTGTLYCTLLLWGPDGELLNHHRKLKPTASERLIWGEGDSQGLRTMPTELGRVGGLICWENYMPLARAHLYNQGIDLYLAPTADGRESWQATIRHIALEGRCYVLSCNQYVTKADYPQDLDLASQRELAAAPDPLSRGGSAIVGPLGEYVAGPLWDEAGILYGEIDPGAITEARFDFDAAGHYSRPDVFTLTVQPPAAFTSLLNSPLLSSPLLNPFLMSDNAFYAALDSAPEPFFGPPEGDPFYDALPAAFSEKKGPARTPPKHPRPKRTKRRS